MTKQNHIKYENDLPSKGWFLVWVSASSEQPLLIEHDLDIHNWGNYLVKVEGPYSRTGAKARAFFRYHLRL